MNFDQLYSVIQQRIKTLPADSYVANLYKQGNDRILQKVGEEAVELLIAGKGRNKKRIIEETSDLCFMILIFLAAKKIDFKSILQELEKRK